MTPFGDFGPPPDIAAWGALVGAAVAAWLGRTPFATSKAISDRRYVVALAGAAALLSWGYVVFYLRGGPRIIDATTYYLQGRSFAEGHVVMPVPTPSGTFRGRFLLADVDGRTLSGIFPPGYPAILALGFLARAPMLVGPIIAALLVVVTYALARRCFEDRGVARLAAAVSVVCVVLRYHTADTMSHGWSALLVSVVLWAALGVGKNDALLAGAAAGWLVATRPLTGLVGAALAIGAMRRAPHRIAWFSAGAALPVLSFLVQQRMATGVWFGSTQLAYYALADGPDGCFRYGFGSGVGCLFEHGDFVRARLAAGYGALAALGTTLRRLKMHLSDAGNAEPFSLLLVYGCIRAFREPRGRLLVLALVALVLAYFPFYFDGNYPGGGARFYADGLPLEHVLLAWAAARLSLMGLVLPLSLAGFALHTVHDHRRLAEREGGRPLFEAETIERAGVRDALVFVDTDHGFLLGFDPDAWQLGRGVRVARRRRDAHDRVVWERSGRPPSFRYAIDVSGPNMTSTLVPFEPEETVPVVIEAEAEWPPLAVSSGYVLPSYPACASGHRALELHAVGEAATMRIALVAPRPGRYRLRSSWVIPRDGRFTATLRTAVAAQNVSVNGPWADCRTTEGPEVSVGKSEEFLEISTRSKIALDRIELLPADD